MPINVKTGFFAVNAVGGIGERSQSKGMEGKNGTAKKSRSIMHIDAK